MNEQLVSKLETAIRTVGSKLGEAIIPGWIESTIEVKIIGAFAVPTACNLPPRATNNAVADAPEPASPLIIQPGSIVNVTPFTTVILPPKI